MTTHELKTGPEWFEAVRQGLKTAELRKDDRGGFTAGDVLQLNEWAPGKGYTGRKLRVIVTHVAVGETWPAPAGYALLSFSIEREPCAHDLTPSVDGKLHCLKCPAVLDNWEE